MNQVFRSGSEGSEEQGQRPRRTRRWNIGFGSAQEKMTSVIERRTGEGEKQLPRPSEDTERPVAARSFSGRTLLVALVLVVLVVTIAPTVHRYFQQRAEIQGVQASISRLQDQQKDLEKQESLWKDDDYARQQARERLYYVTPGETAYVVTGQSRTDHQAPGTSAEAETQDQPNWGKSLWQSVATSSQ